MKTFRQLIAQPWQPIGMAKFDAILNIESFIF